MSPSYADAYARAVGYADAYADMACSYADAYAACCLGEPVINTPLPLLPRRFTHEIIDLPLGRLVAGLNSLIRRADASLHA